MATLCLSLNIVMTAPALAQADYPNKPIKLVVGYSAGGPTDVIARLGAQEMGASLGQPVVVENRVGANGNIATESVAAAVAHS
jgi:tripartite-type tricarboxylate transporter receptor subunit TctC